MKNKIAIILFGLVFAAVGMFMITKGNEKAQKCIEETSGVVVEVIGEESEKRDSGGNYSITVTYFPVIEYITKDNRTIKKRYSTGTGSYGKYIEGDEIDILYDPNNEENYLIKGDNSFKIMGYIFTGIGVLVAVLGIVKKED